jgi:hypothetical protein
LPACRSPALMVAVYCSKAMLRLPLSAWEIEADQLR